MKPHLSPTRAADPDAVLPHPASGELSVANRAEHLHIMVHACQEAGLSLRRLSDAAAVRRIHAGDGRDSHGACTCAGRPSRVISQSET